MKIYLLLIFLFLTSSVVRAQELGWSTFHAHCETEFHDEWNTEAVKGIAWTKRSSEVLSGLVEMGQKICPAYLAKRNDGDAIQQFVSAKNKILDEAPVVYREGNRLLSFIEALYKEHKEAFAPAQIDFAKGRCGKNILVMVKAMHVRLEEIKHTLKGVAPGCFEINLENEESSREVSRQKAKRGAEERSHTKAFNSPASGITSAPKENKK